MVMSRIKQALLMTLTMFCGVTLAQHSLAAPEEIDSCQVARQKLSQIMGLNDQKLYLEKVVPNCLYDPQIMYYHAYNLDRRGHGDEALKVYQRTIQLDPGFAKAHYGIGQVLQSKGKLPEAITAFTHGLNLDPNNDWAKKQILTMQAPGTQQQTEKSQKKEVPLTVETSKIPVQESHIKASVSSISASAMDKEIQLAVQKAMQDVDMKKAIQDAVEESKRQIIEQAKQQAIEQAKQQAQVQNVAVQTRQEPPQAFQAPVSSVRTPALSQEGKVESLPADTSSSKVQQATGSKKETIKPLVESTEAIDITSKLSNLTDADLLAILQFKAGERQLAPESLNFVKDNICTKVQNMPIKSSFEVVGHTDDIGSEESNKLLSKNRAETIKSILANTCGIKKELLAVTYFGESMPMVPNTSPENRNINRRVEIRRIR
jgi:outer membrane protein OmpA-like peptidoglycan-associated protein